MLLADLEMSKSHLANNLAKYYFYETVIRLCS